MGIVFTSSTLLIKGSAQWLLKLRRWFYDEATLVWYHVLEFSLSQRQTESVNSATRERVTRQGKVTVSLRLACRTEVGEMTMSSRLVWSSVRPSQQQQKCILIECWVCLVCWIDKFTISFQAFLHEDLLCQGAHFCCFDRETIRSLLFPELYLYWVEWKVWARLWSMYFVA